LTSEHRFPHFFRQTQSHSWNNECVYACAGTVMCCERKVQYSIEQTVLIYDMFCKALNHEGKLSFAENFLKV
jgi:hypothetical protein